jgi:hypothetical protein
LYSLIAFLATLVQLIVMIASYALGSPTVFATFIVYGGPPYLIMNLFNAESAWVASHPIYLVLFFYHLLKYFVFFRARLVEGGNLLLTAAIVFEAAYLCISGYYLF